NNAIVRRLILDSLRYWVEEMHVDGFRFDLAAILSRDERGRPLENPPALWEPGHLWLQGERARAEHQFHHLSRWIYPERPGFLRAQAQRGQRRREPGRRRHEPELELRRRGTHR